MEDMCLNGATMLHIWEFSLLILLKQQYGIIHKEKILFKDLYYRVIHMEQIQFKIIYVLQ